jgi:hypothetical protein
LSRDFLVRASTESRVETLSGRRSYHVSLRMRPQNGALIHQNRQCRWVELSWTPVPNYLSCLFGLQRGISRVGAGGLSQNGYTNAVLQRSRVFGRRISSGLACGILLAKITRNTNKSARKTCARIQCTAEGMRAHVATALMARGRLSRSGIHRPASHLAGLLIAH